MIRLLILAGGGTLGHKMWQQLAPHYKDAFVTIRKPQSHYEKSGLFRSDNVMDNFDLADFSKLKELLDKLRPDVIINCAGVTPRSTEGDNAIACLNINALLPHHLLAWCKNNKGRVIHFSTVCVFDGVHGGYTEESAPNAQDLYGRTKILGELFSDQAITIRSSFIGRELKDGKELLEWFLAQQERQISGYRQAIFTGVTTKVMTDIVRILIEKYPKLSGLFHIASEKLSKYELLLLMKETFKVNVKIVPNDNFVCNRDIKDDKFRRATGFKTPPWLEMMRDLANDAEGYN